MLTGILNPPSIPPKMVSVITNPHWLNSRLEKIGLKCPGKSAPTYLHCHPCIWHLIFFFLFSTLSSHYTMWLWTIYLAMFGAAFELSGPSVVQNDIWTVWTDYSRAILVKGCLVESCSKHWQATKFWAKICFECENEQMFLKMFFVSTASVADHNHIAMIITHNLLILVLLYCLNEL